MLSYPTNYSSTNGHTSNVSRHHLLTVSLSTKLLIFFTKVVKRQGAFDHPRYPVQARQVLTLSHHRHCVRMCIHKRTCIFRTRDMENYGKNAGRRRDNCCHDDQRIQPDALTRYSILYKIPFLRISYIHLTAVVFRLILDSCQMNVCMY